MNQVMLTGNLVDKPEIKYTNTNKPVATFTLACNDFEKAEFINIVTWNKTAENVEKYCNKGDKIALIGRIQTDKVVKDGQTRYYTKVVASRVEFLNAKKTESTENKPKQDELPKGNFNNVEEDLPF